MKKDDWLYILFAVSPFILFPIFVFLNEIIPHFIVYALILVVLMIPIAYICLSIAFKGYEDFTKSIWHNHLLQSLSKWYNKKKYKIIDTEWNYFILGRKKTKEDIQYINDCLKSLEELPNEIKNILQAYPLPLIFHCVTREEFYDLGSIDENFTETIYGSYCPRNNRNQSAIFIYRNADRDLDLYSPVATMYHEIAHYIDDMAYLLICNRSERYFSDVDKKIYKLFKKKEIKMDFYYYSNVSEFYAETFKMYLLKETDNQKIIDYFDNHLVELTTAFEKLQAKKVQIQIT